MHQQARHNALALVIARGAKRPRPTGDSEERAPKRARVDVKQVLACLQLGHLGDARLFLALKGHAWVYGQSRKSRWKFEWHHKKKRVTTDAVRAAISDTLSAVYAAILDDKLPKAVAAALSAGSKPSRRGATRRAS